MYGGGGNAGGGMALMFAVLAIGYLLTLISQEVPLPVPQGIYYFRPNATQALLLEGKRQDERMMLAAAEQKQLALAAAEAFLLDTAATEAERQRNGFGATEEDVDTPHDLSVATTESPSARAAAAAHSLNFSRALMVYDLVFDEDDEWLEGIVDRVQLWNKLFMKQRKAYNWRVSLSPSDLSSASGKAVPVKSGTGEYEDLDEAETQAAVSAREAKRAAASHAREFLEHLVDTQSGDEDFTPEELNILRDLFLSQEEKKKSKGSRGGQAARTGFEPVPVHIFFAADNGTFSGTHELTYVYAAMRYKTRLTVPPRASVHSVETCVDATLGFLKRPVRDALTVNITHHRPIPALAVTTGIYSTRASACVAYILSLPMFDVQSITFLGTAGVSPVVGGGGWNPEAIPYEHASSATSATSKLPPLLRELQQTPEYAHTATNLECQSEWVPWSTKVALGSVCVTHAAILQECGICHEEMPVTSLCSRPRCSIHNSTTFFGPCNFQLSYRSRRLAESMKGAMMGRPFPPVPPAVKAGMERFWAANEAMPKYRRIQQDSDVTMLGEEPEKAREVWFNGWAKRTEVAKEAAAAAAESAEAKEDTYEYLRDPPESPTLLHCAEVDTSQILAGARSDALCREYSHTLLHVEDEPGDWEARKRQVRRESGEETAAEAPRGRLKEIYPRSDLTCVQAMEGFGFLQSLIGAQFPHIPVALVRAGSNYNMYPLRKIMRAVPLRRSGYRTRQEVLAQVEAGTLEQDEASRAHTVSEGLDVDGTPRSTSVGASGRKLRQLFANEDLAEGFQTRGRLKFNAEEVAQAQKRLSGGEDTEATELDSDYYHVGWEQNTDFMTVEEYEQYTKASYQYAVETSSAVVLNFFLRDDARIPGRALERPRK